MKIPKNVTVDVFCFASHVFSNYDEVYYQEVYYHFYLLIFGFDSNPNVATAMTYSPVPIKFPTFH